MDIRKDGGQPVSKKGLAERLIAERLVTALNEAVEAGHLPRSGRVTTISTRNGLVAVLDEEEAWATVGPWHTHKSGRNTYFCRSYSAENHVTLHNHILPVWPGRRIDVDHIDGDSLNNRRANLHYLTHSENVARGMRRPPSSGPPAIGSAHPNPPDLLGSERQDRA